MSKTHSSVNSLFTPGNPASFRVTASSHNSQHLSPNMQSFQAAPKYRDAVVAAALGKSFPPVIPDLVTPAVTCLRYHHLGLVCRDLPSSQRFYAPLGFEALPGPGLVRLRGCGGLELHLIQADDCAVIGNLLMDDEKHKPPGHTHTRAGRCRAFLPSNTSSRVSKSLSLAPAGAIPPHRVSPAYPPHLPRVSISISQHSRGLREGSRQDDARVRAQRWRR